MQELNDEYCEVLEAVRIDCHSHRLYAGLGPQLDLEKSKRDTIRKGVFQINFQLLGNNKKYNNVQNETCHHR